MTPEYAYDLVLAANPRKITLSRPSDGTNPYRRVVIEKKRDYFQASGYTETQVFHLNIRFSEMREEFARLCAGFLQINAFCDGEKDRAGEKNAGEEIEIIRNRNGRVFFSRRPSRVDRDASVGAPASAGGAPASDALFMGSEHDRKKRRVLEEGVFIAPLKDMGVITGDGKVVSSMQGKFRQINRFLEILDDEISSRRKKTYRIIDFGCGKSYLTFIVYHYLTEIRDVSCEIVGIDLKEDVIRKCNDAAKRYGYDNLRFERADIKGYEAPFRPDIVMTLHACDTATDYALYNAVNWGAEMIFSVPCCQHELNSESKSVDAMTRYGIVKERFCALATDAIRAEMLEYSGYKTQLLEFVDFEHTPKNILIRAVRRPFTPDSVRERAKKEITELTSRYGFDPAICRLLADFSLTSDARSDRLPASPSGCRFDGQPDRQLGAQSEKERKKG